MNAPAPSPRPGRAHRLVVGGRDVASAELADTYLRRLRGLLGRRRLPEALLLTPCSSVHGLGMLRSVEVALLAEDGTVLGTRVLRPFAVTAPRRDVTAVLEAPLGSFERWGLVVGSTAEVRAG